MDIMTTLGSDHSLVYPKQDPIGATVDDSTSSGCNVEEVQRQNRDSLPLTTDGQSATSIPSNGVVPPVKLRLTFSLSGKKQYRKRKPKTKEDRELSFSKKKFSFVSKEKVTTRATTPSERLFCRKCNIQLFSHNLFELHTKDHALKSLVSVAVERLHLSPEIQKTLSSSSTKGEEETGADHGMQSDVDCKVKTDSGELAIDICDTTRDWVDDTSLEASTSFNQSLEKFQTDMIEELHKQIRRLSEASSPCEDKADGTASSGDNEIVTATVVVPTPVLSDSVADTRMLSRECEFERCCPSVAIIEKEPTNVTVAQQQRFPVPSVLGSILRNHVQPPPPLQGMARMAFSTSAKQPFARQVDDGRPASVVYVDTVRPQLPSIESVISLAPGYKQQPRYSNATFPTATNNGVAQNKRVDNGTAPHVTSGHSCTCANCKDLLEGSLLREAKVVLQGGLVEFHCPICKRRFQRKSSLWRHCRMSKHGHICNMCGSGFLQQDMFEQHRQLHLARLSANAQGGPAPQSNPHPSTSTAPAAKAAQGQPARRPGRPLRQIVPKPATVNAEAAADAGANKDDDVIVVAVGKTTSVASGTLARNPASQSSNARVQKDAVTTPSNKSNAPSQNINRILQSNEITLTPIGSRSSSSTDGPARLVRGASQTLHANQAHSRPVFRGQGPPQRFEGSNSCSVQRNGPQQSSMGPNSFTTSVRASLSMLRPTGPTTSSACTVSQPMHMNTGVPLAVTRVSGPRGQMPVSGNRMPQLHPVQMMAPMRMAQMGEVRMPVWHHPVAAPAAVPQRPQYPRPPQLVTVKSSSGISMTAQSMAAMRPPNTNGFLRFPSSTQVSCAPPRRPVMSGLGIPSNTAITIAPFANLPSSEQMHHQVRPSLPYFRPPIPYARPLGEGSLKCVHCSATFSNHASLQEHFAQTHMALLTCRRCNAKFRSVVTLKRHEAVCIEKVRCLKCKQVMHHDQLVAHITNVHYPKGNDAIPSQPGSATFLPDLGHNVQQPSANVPRSQEMHNAGTRIIRESQSSLTQQIVSTMAIRTPVIASVISLSRVSPKGSERTSGPSNNASSEAVPVATDLTPIVIDDDANEEHPATVQMTDGSTDAGQLACNGKDDDASVEAEPSGPPDEQIVDVPKALPVSTTPPLQGVTQTEPVSEEPDVEIDEKAVASPPLVPDESVVDTCPEPTVPLSVPDGPVDDGQPGDEAETVDVEESEPGAKLSVQTPSPSVGTASPEPVITDSAPKKQLLCPICDQTLETNELFLQHIRIHGGAEVYGCALCDKSFNAKRLLVAHLRSHMRSCNKSPDAKRRRLNGPPNFGSPLPVQGSDRIVVALLDMEKVVSSSSVLRDMGVVGFLPLDKLSQYLARKNSSVASQATEELPETILPDDDSTVKES